MQAEEPIIVIKKKGGGHGGHHGGAWKVAYADFVTAMMSLFIVLWLMSSTSKETQKEIAGYFRDPKGVSTLHGASPKPAEINEKKDDMVVLKNDLLKTIREINALDKLRKQIEITVTDEGLRIELLEDAKGTFFELGSSKPEPVLAELLQVLAGQLKTLPNSISIEGHTDALPYSSTNGYGNWELSTDRANVARREMQAYGIRADQISQVRGFADQRLHLPDKPFDPANRRISLVVQHLGNENSSTKVADQDSVKGEKTTGPDAAEPASVAVKKGTVLNGVPEQMGAAPKGKPTGTSEKSGLQ
jgi:chemotaxis protein MotB